MAGKKTAVQETEAFFEERRARADMEAFRRILDRPGGERPRPGDELPAVGGRKTGKAPAEREGEQGGACR